jgi:hypothetical protein
MIFEVDALRSRRSSTRSAQRVARRGVFDAPTKDWVARRNAPTVDIYLYDIREDTSRRQIVPELMRDQATRVGSERRMPPRRFRLSYLVTAWTQRPEDEHRLLAAVLATFVATSSSRAT